MAILKFETGSRGSLVGRASVAGSLPAPPLEKDFFWTGLQSEPNYTDTPDGVITYDSATTSLLISDRTALTDYQDTSISMCYGSLNASNCTSLNSVTLSLTYVHSADFSNSSIQSLDLNFEPEIKTVITTNCSNLTSLNLFYVATYNAPEYYPSFDLSTSPNLNSLNINYVRTNGINLSGNTQLFNFDFGLLHNNSYMGTGSQINISNSNIQTCNVAYSYCSEFYADNCTSLTTLNLNYAYITNLSLANLPACNNLFTYNLLNLETVNLNNVGVSYFEINNTSLLTSINIANCTSLSYLYVLNCPGFTGDITLSGPTSLSAIYMQNNGWSSTTVDNILVKLETWAVNQNLTGVTIMINGNSAPTELGLIAKSNLESNYFWVVISDPPQGSATIWSGLNYDPTPFFTFDAAATAFWDPGTGPGDGTIEIQNGDRSNLISLNTAYSYGLGGALDVSGATNLTSIEISDSGVSSLNITNCIALKRLLISGANSISNADVSLAIIQLDAYGNTDGTLVYKPSIVLTPEAEAAKANLQTKGWIIVIF